MEQPHVGRVVLVEAKTVELKLLRTLRSVME